MKKELEKIYSPEKFEERLYKKWNDSGYFHAEVDFKKEPYTIVIPPPNITGKLHMGHALDETIQDILIRFKRMQGYAALWVPGTDHAAIATEAKVVEKLKEEGTSKEELKRDKFLERVWQWKDEYGNRIVDQLKKLGSSCDWQRERFTLDEGCSEAVKEFFVSLYEEGLIYRGEKIINWCPKCQTSISDAEVEYNAQDSFFWHMRYPFVDGSGYLEIATTRPETMLGDTAVAVNPHDKRYRNFVGKKLILPLVNREIPIIADDYVDMEFGTGAVKITPAHDPNDFEVGLRHNLPVINVFTNDAHMNDNSGKYAGMDRYEARKAIVEDLKSGGFIVKIEPHSHNVGQCYRCGSTVEPKVSNQWFVKMSPLAQPAIKAVKNKETCFVPSRFEKIYFHWMENIKDWCISRQLWWGHRIPAWYCEDCGEIIVSKVTPEVCSKCGSSHLHQDEDTLDTWFSSALWPYSTLGWPNITNDYKYFYPTNTLVTGYDIIFFWVARMIFSALKNTGEVPFKHVFIHGLVRDEKGRKMSKSLGNGVDPLDVMNKYGADALRFMLANGTNAGNDMRYSEEKVIAARNFANKLWNASRFILMNLDENVDLLELPTELAYEDMWIITKLNKLIKDVTD
ncbi:MAG: valine--tRNA ligase, partial [Oscillospiraceae bacterium]|nr:valine--tRNA ligase [Oscillospiraceae bacterium]